MRYHLFQKFFGKTVRIKKKSFLYTRGITFIWHNCNRVCIFLFKVRLIINYIFLKNNFSKDNFSIIGTLNTNTVHSSKLRVSPWFLWRGSFVIVVLVEAVRVRGETYHVNTCKSKLFAPNALSSKIVSQIKDVSKIWI